MIHFFCSTPLQIYTSIVMKLNCFQGEKARIYVIDYFIHAEEYLQKLNDTKLFDDVILVKAKKMYLRLKPPVFRKVPYLLWHFIYYTFYERYLRKYKVKVKPNDTVFFSYLEPICLMLTKLNKTKELLLHFCGYEDGIGAYTLPLERAESRIEHFFCFEPYYKKEEYWVYHPEFVIESEKNNLKKIPFYRSKELLLSTNKVWDIKNVTAINKEIIFFDDLISDNEIKRIFEIVQEGLDSEIMVKMHPRRFDLSIYNNKKISIYEPRSLPFEVCMQNKDLSSKVLINIFSSAVINCIFMFNQFPTIVFLYKIINDSAYKEREEEIDLLVEKLRSMYKDNKIYVPETLDELKLNIQQIMNNL